MAYKARYHVYVQTEIVNNYYSFKELAIFDKLPQAQKFIEDYNRDNMTEYKAFYVKS